jgi:hypothetical protein
MADVIKILLWPRCLHPQDREVFCSDRKAASTGLSAHAMPCHMWRCQKFHKAKVQPEYLSLGMSRRDAKIDTII